MNIHYKEPLTLPKMTNYLRETKNVTYVQISEKQARRYLYQYSYVNLITPFKHLFKNNGVYRSTDFKEYLDAYLQERNQYPILYKNIMALECCLKSILSYEILNAYQLKSYTQFQDLAETLRFNAQHTPYTDSIKSHMYKIIDKMRDEIQDYRSPYFLLGQLTLHECLSLLYSLDTALKNHCRKEFLHCQNFIQESDDQLFYEQLDKIIQIRNCICHNDSLESLIRYQQESKGLLRLPEEQNQFLILVDCLLKNE
ncbi:MULTISPECIES: Abi family protein [Terrabacteria group]|uniref:Abi family protein n=1 Tax=Bacillati TaxID=1783272 RepID=UPI00193A6E3F|nr:MULTISPECIES: Abi family protein [Terrabacteria group]MBW9212837.1 Abi family protein [Trueperella sp. zg.1013]QRG86359.1 Abi family protein [Bulleidia sp. zg-1006]